jgi:hypothetical protein
VLFIPLTAIAFVIGMKKLEIRVIRQRIEREKERKLYNEKMKALQKSMTPGEWANYLLNLEINASLKKLNEPKYQPGARFGVFKQLDEE